MLGLLKVIQTTRMLKAIGIVGVCKVIRDIYCLGLCHTVSLDRIVTVFKKIK